MRIAITNPYCWPQVRRGSERLLHDLSHWLANRGHDVTVISSAPGHRRTEQDGGVHRILVPQREPLRRRNRWLNSFHLFTVQVARELLRGQFDAVFCLNYHDAFGALMARGSRTRFRLTYMMTGIAIPNMFRSVPLDGLMFAAVTRGSEGVISVSGFARDALHTHYGRPSWLLQSPTDTAPYLAQPKKVADDRLDILFVADVNEPRKGALLLARAFAIIRQTHPNATLAYSGQASPASIETIRAAVADDVSGGITFHGVGKVEELPALYAKSTVFVNPAVWEAQGMVLVEALAAGTPVVACDHGGVTDIVSDPRIGRLFAPGEVGVASNNETGLAEAILQAAVLARAPETASLCRAHAASFGFDRLGPVYEAVITGAAEIPCAGTNVRRMKQPVIVA